MARRRRHLVERAVDAVTNFEFVLEGLEMDVARAVLDRLKQDQIDEANDRRGVRFRLDVDGAALVAAQRQQLPGFAELLEDFLHAGGVAAVVALDALLDLIGRGDDDMNVFAERKTEIFGRAQIERINQGDGDPVLARPHGQGTMKARQAARNQPQHFRRDLARERHVFRA